ncbi:MAG: MFS transporter [Chloroflexi bacterium]|nr:MFS transporter [Chloroflexota bacterium]NOG63737.1 MFS transporter [Chloroflexota bacterium]
MTTLTQIQMPPQARTLDALRYDNFRKFFFGQLVSVSGTWMQRVAQGWLVFHLTQSELWLGLVACAAGIPTLFFAPFAGVLVDRYPRRQILLATQIALMIMAFILAVLTFMDVVQVWHVMVLAALSGVAVSFEAPSRHTLISDMVGLESLNSGIALNSIMMNASAVTGPTLAGILLIEVGPAWCFMLNAASFLAVIISLLLIHIQNVTRRIVDLHPLEQLREGLSFSRHHPTIRPLLMLAAFNSVFGLNMVNTLLPAFSAEVLDAPKSGLAAIVTAMGIGSVIGGTVNVALGRRLGRGRFVSAATFIAPLLVLIFSRLACLPFNMFIIGLAGFGFMSFYVTTNTLIQSQVIDEYRGRVLSLYTLTFLGLAPLGALFIGSTAQAIGSAEVMTLCAAIDLIACMWIVTHARAVRVLV